MDKKYLNMEGPYSTHEFSISQDNKADQLWITGYDVEILSENAALPEPQKYLCHSVITRGDKALVTISQGQENIRFPEGFGIPTSGDTKLTLFSQVLNPDDTHEKITVRNKSTVHVIDDHALTHPLKPLFLRTAIAFKKGEKFGLFSHLRSWNDFWFDVKYLFGLNCRNKGFPFHFGGVNERNCSNVSDDFVTLHWLVKPGRDINRSDITKYLAIPYDTTIHYINFHVHPFAESIELRDATDNVSLFKSSVQNTPDQKSLAPFHDFSSQEGIPVYKNHRYELISVYNNTSSENKTAMAVMFLYLLDKSPSGG